MLPQTCLQSLKPAPTLEVYDNVLRRFFQAAVLQFQHLLALLVRVSRVERGIRRVIRRVSSVHLIGELTGRIN